MRTRGSSDELERRRQRGVALVLAHDYSTAEAAEAVGVAVRSIQRWVAAYQAEGRKGLVPSPTPGRPSILDENDLEKLEGILLDGPVSSGFENDLWTCERVGQVIQETFGVKFHRGHVWRLLLKLGWSPQKPERRAIERDDKAIQKFVKIEWKKLVKNAKRKRPP